jgi:hypothetical protein
MSFFDSYGLGMQQDVGLDLQARDPRMQNAAPRMITPSPASQGSGITSFEDLQQAISGSGFVPPLGSTGTPPWNPAPSGGGVSSASPMPASPAVINGATGAVEPPAIAPTSIPMPEGVTRRDRLMAGFSMMAAAGTPQFSQVAAGVNVGLIEKEKNAEKARRELMSMTKPQSYQIKENGQIFQVTEPAKARYNKETNSVELIPVEELEKPTYERLLDARTQDAKPRAIRQDQNGVPRYEDNGERVFPGVEPDPTAAPTLEKLAVPRRMVELQNIIEDPEADETERQDAREELAAIESMLPGDEVASARQLLLVNSVKNSEARLASFAEGMDGVVYAKRVTEDMLERIESGEIDTGILSGILTNMGLGDVGQGELKAKQIFQLLQNLQITKLTPVSNFEIDLVSQAWADVANGKAQNLGALKAALETMNAKMNQGFSAYGRDLQNVRSANEGGAYDNILGNYEGYLGDYGYEVVYDEQGKATVRKNTTPIGGSFDDLWDRKQAEQQ